MIGTTGVPIELLFTIILVLIGVVYNSDKKNFAKKFTEIDNDLNSFAQKLDANSKSLSKDELNEVKGLIRETVENAINSRSFREDISRLIKDTMLHIESNRSKSQASMFVEMQEELERKFESEVKSLRQHLEK